jgi:hypothetical protein
MTTNYLQIAPVSGKWYVSERVRSGNTRWHAIDVTQARVDRSPSLTILAGPFDSRDQAKNWNKLVNGSGYIWDKP